MKCLSQKPKGVVTIHHILAVVALVISMVFYSVNKINVANKNVIKCKDNLTKISKNLDEFIKSQALQVKADTYGEPDWWMRKFLESNEDIPLCPEGGRYRANKAWELYCDYHEKILVPTGVIDILAGVEQRIDVTKLIDEDVELYRQGQSFLRLKDYEKAIRSFEKAAELKPDNASYHYTLAGTFYRANKLDSALKSVDEALKLAPNQEVQGLKKAIISALRVKNYLGKLKGKWKLLFRRQTAGEADNICISDIDGSNIRVLFDAFAINGYHYHQGEKTIYFGADGNIFRMPLNGGKHEKIHDNLGYPCFFVIMSPDMKNLLFSSMRFSKNLNLFIKGEEHKAEITDCMVLSESNRDDYSPIWHPDSDRIYFLSGEDEDTEIMTILKNGKELRSLSNNSFEEKGLSMIGQGRALGYSRNMLIQKAEDYSNLLYSDIFYYDLQEEKEENITRTASFNEEYPSWSLDGKKIAFIGWSDDKCHDLYVIDSDGTNRKKLTDFASDPETGRTFHPIITWSPDGDFIVFSWGYKSSLNLYIADVNTASIMPLTDSVQSDIEPYLISND